MGILEDLGWQPQPPLAEKQFLRLLRKSRRGDARAREKIVGANLKLVLKVVQRFAGKGWDLEELFQVGVVGLLKAVDNFDPAFGTRFSSYAVPMILGEIRRFLRDSHPVKVKRALKELGIRARRAAEKLAQELGREATVGEIAAALGADRAEVVAALEALAPLTSVSASLDPRAEDAPLVGDVLRGEEDAAWVEKIALREALALLPARLRRVVVLRFIEDKTQAEVGEILGISQVQVSRLERRALSKLRELLR